MRHRTTLLGSALIAVMGLIVLLVAGTAAAFAEEAKKDAAGAAIRPMEIYACKFKEGKGMADLQAVSTKFNAWMDSTGQHNYWAFLLTPYYHSQDQDFDVAWAGGWRTGVDMAREIQRWVEEGGPVAGEFDKVVTCNDIANYALMDLSPAPNPPDSGPVTFTNCTVQGGAQVPRRARRGQRLDRLREGARHHARTTTCSSRPTASRATAKYSFKWVTTSSWDDWGKSYDQYGTGGGWARATELYDGLLDCDSGRVYVSQRVRACRRRSRARVGGQRWRRTALVPDFGRRSLWRGEGTHSGVRRGREGGPSVRPQCVPDCPRMCPRLPPTAPDCPRLPRNLRRRRQKSPPGPAGNYRSAVRALHSSPKAPVAFDGRHRPADPL